MAQSNSIHETLSPVLARDKSLAHDLYPVCQELAAAVVDGCSRVRLDSVSDLALLLDSPRWAGSAQQRLKKLTLGGYPGANDGAPACPFPGIHVWVTRYIGAGLGRSKALPPKIPLELEGLPCLAPKCRQLRVLHIAAGRRLDSTPESVAALAAAAAQAWRRLEHLGVECVLFGMSRQRRSKVEALLAAAASTAPWQRLRYLSLSHNNLGLKAAQALAAAAPCWPQLQHLDLGLNCIGPQGAWALVMGAEHWPQLQCLVLSGNPQLRAKGAAAIALAGQHWPQLTELGVSGCGLGPSGAVALLRGAKRWPRLQRLHMAHNAIAPEGARALAAAAVHWPDLQELDVTHNELGREGLDALEPAFRQHWPRLRQRKLEGNGA